MQPAPNMLFECGHRRVRSVTCDDLLDTPKAPGYGDFISHDAALKVNIEHASGVSVAPSDNLVPLCRIQVSNWTG